MMKHLEKLDSEKIEQFLITKNNLTKNYLKGLKLNTFKKIILKSLENNYKLDNPKIIESLVFIYKKEQLYIYKLVDYIHNKKPILVNNLNNALKKNKLSNYIFKEVIGINNNYYVKLSYKGSDLNSYFSYNIKTNVLSLTNLSITKSLKEIKIINKDIIITTGYNKSIEKAKYPNTIELYTKPLKTNEIIFSSDIDVFTTEVKLIKHPKVLFLFIERLTMYKSKFYLSPKKEQISVNVKSIYKGNFHSTLVFEQENNIILFDLSSKKKKTILTITEQSFFHSVSVTKNFIFIVYYELMQKKIITIDINLNKYFYIDNNLTYYIETISYDQNLIIIHQASFIEKPTLVYYDLNLKTKNIINTSNYDIDSSDYIEKLMYCVVNKNLKIPYTLVMRKDLKNKSNLPTLISGYGGFGISQMSNFSYSRIKCWIDEGGVFVNTNIRGGKELGEDWHNKGKLRHKINSITDFANVIKDLIEKRITTSEKIGLIGGSNGGLLVSSVMTLYPRLVNCVVGIVSLIDMKKFHTYTNSQYLIKEYGNPDLPEDWNYIKEYAPLENIHPKIRYPKSFFITNSMDDRVHPVHSRKIVYKLCELNNQSYLYEADKGGHIGFTNIDETSTIYSLVYAFLFKNLIEKHLTKAKKQ